MTTVKEFANYIQSLFNEGNEGVKPSPFLDTIGLTVDDVLNTDNVLNAIETELNKLGSGSNTHAYEYHDFVICVCETGQDIWKEFCVNCHDSIPHLPEMYKVKLDYEFIYITKHYDFLEGCDENRVNDWSTITDSNLRIPLETLYNSFGYEGNVYRAFIGDDSATFHMNADFEEISAHMFANATDMLELFYTTHPVLKTLWLGLKYALDYAQSDDMLLDCLPCNICLDDDDTIILYDMIAC